MKGIRETEAAKLAPVLLFWYTSPVVLVPPVCWYASAGNTGKIAAASTTPDTDSTGSHLCQAISQALKRATVTTEAALYRGIYISTYHIIPYVISYVKYSVMDKSMQSMYVAQLEASQTRNATTMDRLVMTLVIISVAHAAIRVFPPAPQPNTDHRPLSSTHDLRYIFWLFHCVSKDM